MRKIIISLGGSLIIPDEIDTGFLKSFKEFILDLVEGEVQAVIITGGGKIARVYMDAAPDAAQDDQDFLGIYCTRVNAYLLKSLFGEKAYEEIILDPTEKIETDRKIILGGGWKPGHSTDTVAVKVAEMLGAKEVLNLSNIQYVYDRDPNKFPDAQSFEKISWKDFRKIVGDEWKPGLNAPFDPVASKEAEKLGLDVVIMDGNIQNIKDYTEGKDFIGTLISDN